MKNNDLKLFFTNSQEICINKLKYIKNVKLYDFFSG